MDTRVLIKSSIEDVKDWFNKLGVDLSTPDITGRNEAMFNNAFIKAFCNRLNSGDYEYFKNIRSVCFCPKFTFEVPINDEN